VEIRLYPDPALRRPTRPVEQFDGTVADLAEEMVRTMRAGNGLGLAAPQVGVAKRLVIVSPDGQPGHETVMVNPEIVETEGWIEAEEGCLSFPGIYVKIGRFARVLARYQDVQGRAGRLQAEGLLARAVQHEIDHLEGRLLVDRMSTVQRMAQRRRLRELQRRYDRPLERTAAGDGRPDAEQARRRT
jgi:peptide deformylase